MQPILDSLPTLQGKGCGKGAVVRVQRARRQGKLCQPCFLACLERTRRCRGGRFDEVEAEYLCFVRRPRIDHFAASAARYIGQNILRRSNAARKRDSQAFAQVRRLG